MPDSKAEKQSWFQGRITKLDDLEKMLNFASANYSRHTDWFLKHRDRALTQLAAIVTAEFTLANINADASVKQIYPVFYILLATLAGILGWCGVMSCRRSFGAALESVVMINKAIWAMGFGGTISAPGSTSNKHPTAPYSNDETFIAPRWIADAAKFSSTEELINDRLGKELKTESNDKKAEDLLEDYAVAIKDWMRPRNNTCYWSCLSIGALAVGGIVFGLMLAVRSCK